MQVYNAGVLILGGIGFGLIQYNFTVAWLDWVAAVIGVAVLAVALSMPAGGEDVDE